MRKYSIDDERTIRTERLVREWTRSGLLDQAQQDRFLGELKVDLRRTNVFLRLVLFAFGALIITASVILLWLALKPHDDSGTATLLLFGGAGAFVLAESLVNQFQLYRFGVEEATASMSGVFVAVAGALFSSGSHSTTPAELAAAVAGSIAALTIYLRFGYLYAAIASMACLMIAPFEIHGSGMVQRLTSAGLLAVVFAVARIVYRECDGEYPAGDCAAIQASAWAGIYLVLNLHIRSLASFGLLMLGAPDVPRTFYWFTYGAIWLIPAVGLYLGLRERDRSLLDINILLALLTFSTNKPYFGAARQTWDPILLGVLLIGTALAVRRWLAHSPRGLTTARLLSSDKRRLSMIGTASSALHTGPSVPTPQPREFDPGGGRSGGAGAGGSF